MISLIKKLFKMPKVKTLKGFDKYIKIPSNAINLEGARRLVLKYYDKIVPYRSDTLEIHKLHEKLNYARGTYLTLKQKPIKN